MSAEPSSKKPKSDDTDTQFLDLTLPFPAAKYRDLAFEVLIADKDPKNSRVKRTIAVSGEKELAVKFESKDLKSIRTAATSFFELFLLCLKTIERFEE